MSGYLAGKVWFSALHPDLKPLAATLADIANDDGTSIYPSVAYVAWRLGVSTRTVQRGLSCLRDMGILVVVGNGSGGRNQTTEYRLVKSKLPGRPSWKNHDADDTLSVNHDTDDSKPRHPEQETTSPVSPETSEETLVETSNNPPTPLPSEGGVVRLKVTATTIQPSNTLEGVPTLADVRAEWHPQPKPQKRKMEPAAHRRKRPFRQMPSAFPSNPVNYPPDVAEAMAYARATFEVKTGHSPCWNSNHRHALWEFVQQYDLSLDEFKRRWDIFLASDDPFDLKQGFSLIWFCRNPDRYIQRVVAKSKREQEIERSDKSLDQWLQGKQNEKKRLVSG